MESEKGLQQQKGRKKADCVFVFGRKAKRKAITCSEMGRMRDREEKE